MNPSASVQPELVGPRVTLRDPFASDAGALLAILLQPEVSFWWVDYNEQRVRAEIIEVPESRVIEVGSVVAGALFVIRGDDPEYPTTVMHIFLGTEFRGQRLGEEAVALAVRHEFASGMTRVTLDPNIGNEGAIRSYDRLGFRHVGVLRQYQRRPDGSLDDALFMELTRDDFEAGSGPGLLAE